VALYILYNNYWNLVYESSFWTSKEVGLYETSHNPIPVIFLSKQRSETAWPGATMNEVAEGDLSLLLVSEPAKLLTHTHRLHSYNKKHLKNVAAHSPLQAAARRLFYIAIHQVSLLSHAACASMYTTTSTTTTTTTTRDRGDRYGPMEWAQSQYIHWVVYNNSSAALQGHRHHWLTDSFLFLYTTWPTDS